MTRTPDGRPTTAFPLDLAVAAGLTLLGLIAALTRLDPLRIALGWPLPLLLPGYAILAWLYPAARTPTGKGRALGAWERLGLGAVGSILATAALGILLNFTPAGITLATMAYGLALLTLLFLVLAVNARLQVPPADRPHFTWGTAPDPTRAPGRTSRAMASLLAVSFTAMALVLVLLFPYQPNESAYTNLYLLGDGGKSACLPDTYTTANDPAGEFTVHVPTYVDCPKTSNSITVGLVNHEAKVVTYYVNVFWSEPTPDPKTSPTAATVETLTIQLGPIGPPSEKLEFERQFERTIQLTPPPPSDLQLHRLNVHVHKDYGQGIQAEPDLHTYFYVTKA